MGEAEFLDWPVRIRSSRRSKQIGKNLKSQDVEDALKGLLGGGDGQPRVKPRDILEKLFKKTRLALERTSAARRVAT